MGTSREDQYNIVVISRSFLLSTSMRNVSDENSRENQNTPFVFSKFFFPKILPFKTWCEKNIVQPGRQEMTVGTSALHGEYLRLQIHTFCFSIAAVV